MWGVLITRTVPLLSGFAKLPEDLVAGLAPGQADQLARDVDAFVAASPFVAAMEAAIAAEAGGSDGGCEAEGKM